MSSEVFDELRIVLGSSKRPEVLFFDDDEQPEDLSAATEATLSVQSESGTVVMARSTATVATAVIDAVNSKVTVDPPTDDETKTSAVLTDIVSSTRTMTISGDQTAVPAFQQGGKITVTTTGLTDSANADEYTVVSATLNAGNTDVVVAEDFSSDETSITGEVTFEAGITAGRYVGYAAVKVSGEWLKSEAFYVDFVASGAPTF